ncbi:MAG: hypothetical protein ACRCT8_00345 [Lacipirellulaceae bacterium]
MPMPREEDDDLFPSEADVDFDDDATEKPRKKKGVKADDDTPKPKTAKKKVAKKKVASAADAEVKPVRRKVAKKKAPPRAPADVTAAEDSILDDGVDPIAALEDERSRGKSLPGFGARPASGRKATPAPDRDDDQAPQAPPAADYTTAAPNGETSDIDEPGPASDADADEYGRPRPQANYAVHVYEFGRYKRTVERDFTPEEADAYATEFSRTAKHYGRQAIAGKKEATPAKVID